MKLVPLGKLRRFAAHYSRMWAAQQPALQRVADSYAAAVRRYRRSAFARGVREVTTPRSRGEWPAQHDDIAGSPRPARVRGPGGMRRWLADQFIVECLRVMHRERPDRPITSYRDMSHAQQLANELDEPLRTIEKAWSTRLDRARQKSPLRDKARRERVAP